MLTSLPKENYYLLKDIGEVSLFPLIAAVIEQEQDGQIFVDDINRPQVAFILHKSSFGYLWTSDQDLNYRSIIDFFVGEDKIPQYFHLYNAAKNLVETASQSDEVNIKLRQRMRMNRAEGNFDPGIIELNGYTAKNLDEVSIEDLSVFNLQVIEKFWNSVDDFRKKGFGWIIYEKNQPASIWYALCVVNNNSETDILTLPDYRGKGLATIAGKLIMKTLYEKNINMDWDVFVDNTPSIKIGEGFGYAPYFKYDFLSIFKRD